jgi:hypothetical protein
MENELMKKDLKRKIEAVGVQDDDGRVCNNRAFYDLDLNAINLILKDKQSEFKKLKFASESDSFTKMMQNNNEFVDKSLFVKEILRSYYRIYLITCPSRWGKSTNMEMLKCFLSIRVDKYGNLLSINPINSIFDQLLIGKEADIISEYQGKYPVILFHLKSMNSINYIEIVEQLKDEIIILFTEFKYLRKSTILSQSQTKDFNKYLTGNISESEIESSLQFLSLLLSKHHKQQVYMLIDGYDNVINNAYQGTDYNKIFEIIAATLTNALKGNINIKKIVITGITKYSFKEFFKNIYNRYTCFDFYRCSIMDSKFFGFTEEEIENLFHKANINDKDLKGTIKASFNSYITGNNKLYNPWTIINFFNNLEIKSHIESTNLLDNTSVISNDSLVTDLLQE